MGKKNEKNKISVRQFQKMADGDNIVKVAHKCGEEEIEIEIKKTLSLQEMANMVGFVVETCIDKETGTYFAQLKDFAIYRQLITLYTNIRLPSSPDALYNLIYQTDIIDVINHNVNQNQYADIMMAIDDQIRFEIDEIHTYVRDQISTLIGKTNEILSQNEQLIGSFGKDGAEKLMASINELAGKDEKEIVEAIRKKITDNNVNQDLTPTS